DRNVAAQPSGADVSGTKAGVPLVLAGDAADTGDDVRHLTGEPRNAQRCAVHDLDSLHFVSRYLLQPVCDRFALQLQPIAIEKDIDVGFTKPTPLLTTAD